MVHDVILRAVAAEEAAAVVDVPLAGHSTVLDLDQTMGGLGQGDNAGEDEGDDDGQYAECDDFMDVEPANEPVNPAANDSQAALDSVQDTSAANTSVSSRGTAAEGDYEADESDEGARGGGQDAAAGKAKRGAVGASKQGNNTTSSSSSPSEGALELPALERGYSADGVDRAVDLYAEAGIDPPPRSSLDIRILEAGAALPALHTPRPSETGQHNPPNPALTPGRLSATRPQGGTTPPISVAPRTPGRFRAGMTESTALTIRERVAFVALCVPANGTG